MVQTEIACRHSSEAAASQLREWEGLIGQAKSVVRVDGGIQLAVDVELSGLAISLAQQELRCCSFLDIEVQRFDETATITLLTNSEVGQRLLGGIVDVGKQSMGMPIGDVAKQAGVSVATIRYYEERGIIQPVGRVGGKRRFGGEVLARLSFVRQAKGVGFTLDEIRRILAGDMWPELLERKLLDLTEQRKKLDSMIALLTEAQECGCEVVAVCGRRETVTLSRRSNPGENK